MLHYKYTEVEIVMDVKITEKDTQLLFQVHVLTWNKWMFWSSILFMIILLL